MAIFLDRGLFFDFAEISLAPTPALTVSLVLVSIYPPTHPTGKVTGKHGRAKEAKQKLSVYIRRVQ